MMGVSHEDLWAPQPPPRPFSALRYAAAYDMSCSIGRVIVLSCVDACRYMRSNESYGVMVIGF